MKAVIAGNALVFTSDIKTEDIVLLKVANPSALTIKNDDGEEIFAVTTSNMPSIGKYGVAFNGTSRSGDGKATLTVGVPEDIEDAKEFAADLMMPAIRNIEFLEDVVPTAAEEIRAAKTDLINAIEIL